MFQLVNPEGEVLESKCKTTNCSEMFSTVRTVESNKIGQGRKKADIMGETLES